MSVEWGEVYRSSFEELVRYLHRKVWDLERARDLAQEVFVRALRFEPDNPRAWLFRVATNLAKEAEETPELVTSAPHETPVRRVDEVRAARNLKVRFTENV